MGLRELTHDGDLPVVSEDGRDCGEIIGDPRRSREKHDGPLLTGEPIETAPARPGLSGQEPFEYEAISGQTGDSDGSRNGRRTGHDRHLGTRCNRGPDRREPGIGNRGHAGVGDQGHGIAGCEPCTDLGGSRPLIADKVGTQDGRDAQPVQQHATAPGVLGVHHIGRVERRGQSRRRVVQVADGGGAENQASGHVAQVRSARRPATSSRLQGEPRHREAREPRRRPGGMPDGAARACDSRSQPPPGRCPRFRSLPASRSCERRNHGSRGPDPRPEE